MGNFTGADQEHDALISSSTTVIYNSGQCSSVLGCYKRTVSNSCRRHHRIQEPAKFQRGTMRVHYHSTKYCHQALAKGTTSACIKVHQTRAPQALRNWQAERHQAELDTKTQVVSLLKHLANCAIHVWRSYVCNCCILYVAT